MIGKAELEAAAEWAYSSVVEHCVDIAGVTSSILVVPTIYLLETMKEKAELDGSAFFLSGASPVQRLWRD